MKIMIIGAGFTGTQLAKKLINEKHDVILIDNNEDVAFAAENVLDCEVKIVDGNNLRNLEEAGISKVDVLVTLTEDDELNMITCSMVDSIYPDLLKIARVRNYSYYVNSSDVRKNHAENFSENHRPLYGIDYMIQPDVEAAQVIVNAVNHGALGEVISFGSDFDLTNILVEKNSVLNGLALKDLKNHVDFKFIVVYIESQDESSLPSGETILREGDRLGVLFSRNDIEKLLLLCGTKIEPMKKIALVGAGRIGTIVAEKLLGKNKFNIFEKMKFKKKIANRFVIIDSDKTLCNQAKEKFPSAQVFCADATDENFIREEGLDKFDLVICATHNHEMNMIISAYIESLGVEKTIALVAHSDFSQIARKLGVDVPIPMRDTLVDSIMSHIYGKNITGIHTVANGDFEIVECDISSKSKYSDKLLKEISSPGDFLVLLVRKRGEIDYSLPSGDTRLSPGDHIVLIAKSNDQKILTRFCETI